MGWRIDYMLVSKDHKDMIVDSKMHGLITGSDHCPISLDIDFSKLNSKSLTPKEAKV